MLGAGVSVTVGTGVETVVSDGLGVAVLVLVGIGSTVGPVGVVDAVAPPALVGTPGPVG